MYTSIQTLKPIRLVRNASAYHRLLRHRFAAPRRIVNPIIRGLKHLWNPGEAAKRRRLAETVEAPNARDRMLAQDGRVMFEHDAFPELCEALERHGDAIDDLVRQAEERAMHHSANKSMLMTVARDNQLFDMPDLMRFVLSDPILDLSTKYFGRVPLLTAVSIWWSPPNDTLQQSQLFHCDGEDARQLKFLFVVKEVTTDHGPFTVMSAQVSERIKAARGIVASKVDDSVIEEFDAWKECVSLTGKPGAGACVDTCRCLHYGSRGNTKPRVMLMLRFNDHLAPNVNVPDWHLRAGELPGGLNELQKLVLGLKSG